MRKTSPYDHVEAFALMTYRTVDDLEEEVLWNSRDGVTPFIISSRSGKEMQHVKWQDDKCVPNHVPKVGDRIFVDLTRERAQQAAHARVDKYWDDPKYPMRAAGMGTKDEAAERLVESFMKNPGEPNVIEVTQEWLDNNLKLPEPVTAEQSKPLDMLIFCPTCGKQHVDQTEPDICKCGHHTKHHVHMGTGCIVIDCECDVFEIAWDNPPHKSHTCRTDYGGCGKIFRIADFPTNGVAEIKTRGKDDTWPEVRNA